MIWIIGGTNEARHFYEQIHDLNPYLTLATNDGLEFISGDRVQVGRMNYEEMRDFVHKNEIKLIVDMSHPFADIVSKNAKKLAAETHIEYFRYLRDKNIHVSEGIYVDSYEECYELLSTLEGVFFFTVGSKHVDRFEAVRGDNRFIYRMLPSEASIQMAKDAGVHMRDLIGMLGPFSYELNIAFLKNYGANYLVTKESGENSGTDEKIRASLDLGITPIIIKRSEEEGIYEVDRLETLVREVANG